METIRWRLNGQPGKRSAGGRRETNRWRPSSREPDDARVIGEGCLLKAWARLTKPADRVHRFTAAEVNVSERNARMWARDAAGQPSVDKVGRRTAATARA